MYMFIPGFRMLYILIVRCCIAVLRNYKKKKKLRKSFEVFVDSLFVDLAQSSGRTVLSIGPPFNHWLS